MIRFGEGYGRSLGTAREFLFLVCLVNSRHTSRKENMTSNELWLDPLETIVPVTMVSGAPGCKAQDKRPRPMATGCDWATVSEEEAPCKVDSASSGSRT